MNKIIMSIVLTLMIPVTASAAIYHVPADYATIQAGIDAAGLSDTVLVADGVHRFSGNRDINFNGKRITVMSENGPGACTIDINGSASTPYRGFIFGNNETSYSVLRGFTIRNAYMLSGGAGIYCYEASPTISECIFLNNTTEGDGGGILLWESSATITDCAFDNNTAESGAGIAFLNASNSIVTNCTFAYGTSNHGGAIICNSIASPLLINCEMFLNTATAGSGLYLAWDAAPTLMNCTLTDNSASLGGTLHMYQAQATVTNCILWGNISDEIDVQSGSPPVITYSNIYQDSGVYTGSGNINSNPIFIDPSIHNFRLSQTEAGQSSTSPCVNSGSDPASSFCFPITDGQACLDEYSTRTDDVPDAGTVDMGIHYPVSSAPTPTPPPPTPTPSACSSTGCKIWMPDTTYAPGDSCSCRVSVCNASGNVLSNYPLFVILDVFGTYFFAPSFGSFDHYLGQYPNFPVGETVVTVLPDFSWPDGAGNVSGIIWYAALTDPDIKELFGDMDTWTFGWTQ